MTIHDDSPLDWTDTALAGRFADRHHDTVRYVYTTQTWLVWDGQRWGSDRDGRVMRLAQETVRSLLDELQGRTGEQERHFLLNMAKAMEGPRLARLVEMATVEPAIVVRPDQLDANPWLFNVANGTLDLRTGTLRPHAPEDQLTRLAGASYDPDAAAPRWRAFLERILDGDTGLITYLQRSMGYTLTADTTEQKLWFLHGVGANGKSVFIETVRYVWGDYARHAPAETFLDLHRGAGAREDVARLAGARLVTASELRTGQRWDEALVKGLTGGDVVTARHLYRDSFEFRPAFKLWILGNHRPKVRDAGEAFWRRLCLMPFGVTIPEAERDPTLATALREEAPGILAWAVAGCLAWQREGLGRSQAVQLATAEYRNAEDVVALFLDDCCTPGDPGTRTAGQELYAAYRTWAEQRGERPLTLTTFGEELRRYGAERVLINGRTHYKALRLIPRAA